MHYVNNSSAYNKKNSKIKFGRALTTEERKDYTETILQAKKNLGADGKSILIVHDACLPQSPNNNTGVGNLSSKESLGFFDFMKNYIGINHVETLPPGEIDRVHRGLYCPYSSSSMSMGRHQINLQLLTEPEYGKILSKDDFTKVVQSNNEVKSSFENIPLANYENVISLNGKSNQDFAVEKAFKTFQTSTDPKVLELKEKFQNYKNTEAERLEPKALYQVLKNENYNRHYSQWNELDKNLYNSDIDKSVSKQRIDKLNKIYSNDIEFYKFQQFLADEHHKYAKKQLNDKGHKLIGDCPINFSDDEIWSHQGAFWRDKSIGDPGWGISSINYDKIHNPDGSLGEAGKLIQKKIKFFSERYDTLRMDVGYSYVRPRVYTNINNNMFEYNKGDEILKVIENTVKETKGENFNLKNIMYEVDGSDVGINFKHDGPKVSDYFKDRVQIYSTAYMNDKGHGWGSVNFYKNKVNIPAEDFVIGVGNHDPISLRQLAEDTEYAKPKNAQADLLSDFLKVPKDTAQNSKEFAKLKFAELFTGAKNTMFFYMDVLGRKTRFNAQEKNTSENFRYKISPNYEAEYHSKLQEGHGLNMADALSKAFKAKGLDQTNSNIFKKLEHYGNILAEKGCLTEEEANKTIKSTIPNFEGNRAPKKDIKPKSLDFFKSALAKLAIGAAITVLAAGIFIKARSYYKNKRDLKKVY